MEIAEHGNADSGLEVGDRDRAIEHNVAVVEGVGENDGIGVHRRDEVGPWGEILTGSDVGCKQDKGKSEDSCRKLWMSHQPSGSRMESPCPDIGWVCTSCICQTKIPFSNCRITETLQP